jgi:hypothetical protein
MPPHSISQNNSLLTSGVVAYVFLTGNLLGPQFYSEYIVGIYPLNNPKFPKSLSETCSEGYFVEKAKSLLAQPLLIKIINQSHSLYLVEL